MDGGDHLLECYTCHSNIIQWHPPVTTICKLWLKNCKKFSIITQIKPQYFHCSVIHIIVLSIEWRTNFVFCLGPFEALGSRLDTISKVSLNIIITRRVHINLRHSLTGIDNYYNRGNCITIKCSFTCRYLLQNMKKSKSFQKRSVVMIFKQYFPISREMHKIMVEILM